MSSPADSSAGRAKKDRANASNSIAWARSDIRSAARNSAAGIPSNRVVVRSGS